MALTDEIGSSSQSSPTDVDKASSRSLGLQETFLSRAREGRVPLTVFLVNGVRLQGIVTWFDSFSLLLTRGADAQLVYKRAISTIVPLQPLQLYEPEDQSGRPDRTPKRSQLEIRRR